MRIIKFNDKELKVKSLKTTIQPLVSINNSLVSRSRSVSRRLSDYDTTPKLITLNFPFEYQRGMGVSESISSFFFSEEPVVLINPKDENRYFICKIDGEIALEEEGSIAYYTVNLIVPDGVSHKIESNRYEFINDIANIQNEGTYKTPVDINVTFTSDANSIGFVSEDKIIQLGTSISEDVNNTVQSEKVMNDKMTSTSKNEWATNAGKIRWRTDDGDSSSRIQGAFKWDVEQVYPSSYGPAADDSKPGYWHGPTLTKMLSQPLENFETYHRFQFKPTGNSKEKPKCQGLIEINYLDSDNNFVIGFEMKDNATTVDKAEYSFFVGDFRIYTGSLPKHILNFEGGFFGSIHMQKIGNHFTFKLARINQTTWKEIWSISKSYFNDTVAMLSPSIINVYFAKWKNLREMSIHLTHTRITRFGTEIESLIPKTFYEGDNLFVDGKTNRVYINGLRDDGYRVLGSSQVFNAEKGQTEVVAISDGSYTGYLEMRERYL